MATDNGKISVSYRLLEWIFHAGVSASTARLLIALIHQQDLRGLWDETHMQDPHGARTHAAGATLRSRVGPKRDNGARTLKRLLEETRATGLFDSISLRDNNKVLCWQFAQWVHVQMNRRWDADYVLLDLEQVAQCRTFRTLRLYVEARCRYNMKAPAFTGPVHGSWSRYRHPLFASCRDVAGLVDTVFFIGLVPDPNEPGRFSLIFRMRHIGTKWYPHALTKFPADTRVYRIDRSSSRKINPRDFKDYALEDEQSAEAERNLIANLL